MNGWQRLWVLVTLLLGVCTVVAFIHDYPGSRVADTSYSKAMSSIPENEKKWSEFKDAPPHLF